MGHSDRFSLDIIERADGPAIVAFWDEGRARSEFRRDTLEYDWHSHVRGQIVCVESGVVRVRTHRGSWLLPPHSAGWMPPGELHTVSVSGRMSSWAIFVVPGACGGMPDEPCVIGVSELLRALVKRASEWSLSENLSDDQQRLTAVLLDEMRRSPREPLHLPLPLDRRLLRIVDSVLEQPQDNRGLEEWAAWGGLSPRSLSRLFRAETSLSFAQWRQQARLSTALERLADGVPVAHVADALGYANPSAFVAMFRRYFGMPPARYFAQRAVT